MSPILWIIVLFVFSFFIGIVAPISGVGGGVLFVPLATAFFPFNVDFIRGTGLIIAMASSFSSSPYFLRKGLANIRIAVPVVSVSIITSILGSISGLWITNAFPAGPSYITLSLGALLLFIFVIMLRSRSIEFPEVRKQDGLSEILSLYGAWYEPSIDAIVEYKLTRMPLGTALFGVVGFIAGMFGVGAGWASVPVLNLVMGAPIKVSIATSMVIISMNAAAASWVYIGKGATLPLICIPSIAGISIGSYIGSKIAVKTKPVMVKYTVMSIMIFAAALDIVKGFRGILTF